MDDFTKDELSRFARSKVVHLINAYNTIEYKRMIVNDDSSKLEKSKGFLEQAEKDFNRQLKTVLDLIELSNLNINERFSIPGMIGALHIHYGNKSTRAVLHIILDKLRKEEVVDYPITIEDGISFT